MFIDIKAPFRDRFYPDKMPKPKEAPANDNNVTVRTIAEAVWLCHRIRSLPPYDALYVIKMLTHEINLTLDHIERKKDEPAGTN